MIRSTQIAVLAGVVLCLSVAGVVAPVGASDGPGAIGADSPDVDQEIQDGDRVWAGQTVSTDAFDAGAVVELQTGDGDFVTELLVRDDGHLVVDTDAISGGLDSRPYVFVGPDGQEVGFDVVEQSYRLEVDDTEVGISGTIGVSSNRFSYTQVVTSPNGSGEWLAALFGVSEDDQGVTVGEDELRIPGLADGSLTVDFAAASAPPGEYVFEFEVEDTGKSDSVMFVKTQVDGVDVNGNGNPSLDLDGDGRHEDVTGDGRFGVGDVQALFAFRNSDPVQVSPGLFDFNGDGEIGIGDVQALFFRFQGR